MAFIWICGLCFLLIHVSLGIDNMPKGVEYQITSTWDGKPTDHPPIVVRLESVPEGVALVVKAPFFNDPGNPGGVPGEPFWELWKYEVVEAFFANDKQQYVEVELCPWGEQIVLLLDAPGHAFKHSLPLDYKVIRRDEVAGVWEGRAVIPTAYFPSKVNAFNLYAIHGSDSERVYEALFPVPEGQFTEPNFHRLEFFKAIDFSTLLPSNAQLEHSPAWGTFLLDLDPKHVTGTIYQNWDGSDAESNTTITVTKVTNTSAIQIDVEGKFYNDPAPKALAGRFYGLEDYEHVEIVFHNKNGKETKGILGISLGPHGHYLMTFASADGNILQRDLQLDGYVYSKGTDTWNGTVTIPNDYIPPNVTVWNAFAFHGNGKNRKQEALFPAPGQSLNVYDITSYKNEKKFDKIVPQSIEASEEWNNALYSFKGASANNQWNGIRADHSGYQVTLKPFDQQNIRIELYGPFNSTSDNPKADLDLENSDVAELFFSNSLKHYMQLFVSPWGKTKVIFYREKRIIVGPGYTVDDNIILEQFINSYHAVITLPIEFLPFNTTQFNVGGVWHVNGIKEFDCQYPHPNAMIGVPDLHTLSFFEPIENVKAIIPEESNNKYSEAWRTALGL